MITAQQKIEIIEFLLSKKMSVDVIMEIHDHFCTHISEQMEKEDISFEKAFLNTQLSWKSDLKMMKLDNGRLITNFNRTIAAKQEISVLLKAVMLVFVVLLLMFITTQYLSESQFANLTVWFLVALVLVPLIYFLQNFRDFQLIRKFKKITLNTHQKSIIMLGPSYMLLQSTVLGLHNHSRFYDLYHGNFTRIDLATMVLCFCGLLMYFLGLISMFSFIKRLQKTKSFLHYFNY
ncbi:MAG: hypothetical protein K0M63_05970 [Weeksellaceae bacterium]|nr:hypothetical protein [Weeksellaceae bacterium]